MNPISNPSALPSANLSMWRSNMRAYNCMHISSFKWHAQHSRTHNGALLWFLLLSHRVLHLWILALVFCLRGEAARRTWNSAHTSHEPLFHSRSIKSKIFWLVNKCELEFLLVEILQLLLACSAWQWWTLEAWAQRVALICADRVIFAFPLLIISSYAIQFHSVTSYAVVLFEGSVWYHWCRLCFHELFPRTDHFLFASFSPHSLVACYCIPYCLLCYFMF